ncbi:hypothetical protein L5515_019447 [Caenorhabditis briggsae]|uniref:Uncharacterized protein n=1 Tax=Caenorhabditis briggsae TaxID=6238 RepID=A0AAE9JTR9_CAEBR|nr:hypothetical protein L5515_019447 [Caenorhabditis briggsae]
MGHAQILGPTDSNGIKYSRNWRLERVNLPLAIVSPVVLKDSCKNVNVEKGAFGRVEIINDDDITVRFPNGQQVQIKRLEYESGDRRFQQYPLRLAYAHTIERAQGATFDGIMLQCLDAATFKIVELSLWDCYNGLLYQKYQQNWRE